MLRLSDEDERNAREFEKMCGALREAPDCVREFGGRVFRSPTLFEDMVKCILLCNCQFVFFFSSSSPFTPYPLLAL